MGAAASLQFLYRESFHWYKEYFTDEVYVSEFRSIDQDIDGLITLSDLRSWLYLKARVDSNWTFLSSNDSIFTLAHQSVHTTCCECLQQEGLCQHDMELPVGIDQFKVFLMHLYVISILWVHFTNADNWREGNDVGNNKLTLDEFRLACRTLTSAQAQETINDAQIAEDFRKLDFNNDGYVDFKEVCCFCVQFINPKFAEKYGKKNPRPKRSFLIHDLEESSQRSTKSSFMSVDSDKKDPISTLIEEASINQLVANLGTLKINTEIGLLNCGYFSDDL